MGNCSKISSNAREQLDQFTGIFFTRFSKPRLKFLRQMLYGIQITKSVILSKIAAEIDENIKQVKIEMRLCHHLAFKDLWKHIHEAVADGIQKLFTRFGKWSAKLDLKKVLVKPSPQLEFALFTLDFRASSVLQSSPLEGVALRGCGGGAGGLDFQS